MLKLFKKEKKNNKGFTLVELVVVVAILAILVGLLAPQYTKYVERSRKAADAANLDNLVKAVEVAVADNTYNDLIPKENTSVDNTITITITPEKTTAEAVHGVAKDALKKALDEYAGNSWSKTTLKSKSWAITDGTQAVKATLVINKKGSITVSYDPENIKNKEGADA